MRSPQPHRGMPGGARSRAALAALCVLQVLACAGCAGSPRPAPGMPAETIVWPSPPEAARIKYLQSITRPEDIGWSPSFFKKLAGFVSGPEASRQIVRPYGIFCTRKDVLYVADPGARLVHIFKQQDRQYEKIAAFEKQALVSPIGVAVDEQDNLYISDSVLRRVFVFDAAGRPQREIGSDGRLLRPTGIAISHALKRLYVADTTAHAIIMYNLQGGFISSIGRRGTRDGEFNYPAALAIGRDGRLYVNDSLNFRIQIFNPDGTFVSLFGKHGDGIGEFTQPKGVALDSEGHIYVADAVFDTVQIFNASGELLLNFGQAGQGPGNLWMPSTVFIDETNRIFVSDSFNRRVQVFQFIGGSRP